MGKVESFPNIFPNARRVIGCLDVFARTIPVLYSTDIRRTERFYTKELGFQIEKDGDYLIFFRDNMEIHYHIISDASQTPKLRCYIRGEQVNFLYEEFKTKKVSGLSDFKNNLGI